MGNTLALAILLNKPFSPFIHAAFYRQSFTRSDGVKSSLGPTPEDDTSSKEIRGQASSTPSPTTMAIPIPIPTAGTSELMPLPSSAACSHKKNGVHPRMKCLRKLLCLGE